MKIDATPILNQPGSSMHFDLREPIKQPDDDLKIAGAVTARGVATSLGKEVYVQAHATGDVELTCSRCLVKFTRPFDVSSEGKFADEGSSGQDEDEGVEVFLIEGPICVLDDMIRHEVILSLPMKPLCSEKCKGLCPGCGVNLNEGDCECSKEGEKVSPFGRKLIEAMEERSKRNGRPQET